MSEKELLTLSKKTYYVGVWTIVITVFLALAGGAVGVVYATGGWVERMDGIERTVGAHETRIKSLEDAGSKTVRALDRIEFNLKNDIERRGGKYTEIQQ